MTIPPSVQQALDAHQKNKQQEIKWAEGLTEGGVLIVVATQVSHTLYTQTDHVLRMFPHPETIGVDIVRTDHGYDVNERGFTTPIYEIGLNELWNAGDQFRVALLAKIKDSTHVH